MTILWYEFRFHYIELNNRTHRVKKTQYTHTGKFLEHDHIQIEVSIQNIVVCSLVFIYIIHFKSIVG